MQTVTANQLSKLLLNVALIRPVFIWGPPGIGKSALVEQFALDVGLDCVSLVASQLAPEDLIGVPRIEGNRSVFCPPRMIARDDPYLLFVDELNACSFEVQKAFYSLITDRRLGEYRLPEGSVVVGAGNRALDQAIVKPMSSALMNRMLPVELRPTLRDWLDWAYAQGVHEWVIHYLETRPDHLFVQPPKTEETFSTPRAWHILSDALRTYGRDIAPDEVEILAAGGLSASHAKSFGAFVKQLHGKLRIEHVLSGEQRLPREPEERDVLYFIVQSIRAQLAKELPPDRADLKPQHRKLVIQAKKILVQLCEINTEMALVMVAEESGDDRRNLPAWLLVEIVRDLPRLASALSNGMSAEEVYDLLNQDRRRCKGLRGFRGKLGDILHEGPDQRVFRGDVTTMDDIYRRCIAAGLACPTRGLLPAGLLEEIKSLFTPPVPWDVELARWMEAHVPVIRDPLRTYARASRRQSSTPDISRPARYIPQEWKDPCTFGVILDTTGSMGRELLGRALGAIASYAEARDVPGVRLVLCDAAPYDRGVVAPTELRGQYPVQGRGGTVLQPAINHLISRPDFPPTSPIMIITDGHCEEVLTVPREHCFVMPRKAWREGGVPLRTSAPVFRVLKEERYEQ